MEGGEERKGNDGRGNRRTVRRRGECARWGNKRMKERKRRGGEKGKEGSWRRRRAGTLGVTFLKCNQPGAALLPNVNTGQRGGLTACHCDSWVQEKASEEERWRCARRE